MESGDALATGSGAGGGGEGAVAVLEVAEEDCAEDDDCAGW